MKRTKMYSNRAVIFNAMDYEDAWLNEDCRTDFVNSVIENCHWFLSEDWYPIEDKTHINVLDVTITVGLLRYESGQNLQPHWTIKVTDYPTDDLGRQWVVFDVFRVEAHTTYRFEMGKDNYQRTNDFELTDDEIRTINDALSMARWRRKDIMHQLENGVPLIVDYESIKEGLREIEALQYRFDEICKDWIF